MSITTRDTVTIEEINQAIADITPPPLRLLDNLLKSITGNEVDNDRWPYGLKGKSEENLKKVVEQLNIGQCTDQLTLLVRLKKAAEKYSSEQELSTINSPPESKRDTTYNVRESLLKFSSGSNYGSLRDNTTRVNLLQKATRNDKTEVKDQNQSSIVIRIPDGTLGSSIKYKNKV